MLNNYISIIIPTFFILALVVSKVLIIVIEKLPDFIYQSWVCDSHKILNLETPLSSNRLDTTIKHKKYLFIATTIIFIFAALTAKLPLQLFGYLVFISIIQALIVIDYKTMLLPDELTLPLLWLGLIFNLHGSISGSLELSVYGAVFGYLVLWLVFWAFKLLTKKDGMGYGDFKLLSAILAFLGIQYLVPMLLLSSILGIIYFIAMSIFNRFSHTKIDFKENGAIPFGPYLGVSGIILLFWGNSITNMLMHF